MIQNDPSSKLYKEGKNLAKFEVNVPLTIKLKTKKSKALILSHEDEMIHLMVGIPR
jgi:hypothetical protein